MLKLSIYKNSSFGRCAEERTRTSTLIKAHGPKPCLSASFSTSACSYYTSFSTWGTKKGSIKEPFRWEPSNWKAPGKNPNVVSLQARTTSESGDTIVLYYRFVKWYVVTTAFWPI